jgi:hypothetical protein
MFRVVFIFVIGITLGPVAVNAQAQLDTTITNRLDTTGMSSLDSARIDSVLRNPSEPTSENIREANAVVKDSARLAIEAITRQAWRRSICFYWSHLRI